jgi:hypothetical protein
MHGAGDVDMFERAGPRLKRAVCVYSMDKGRVYALCEDLAWVYGPCYRRECLTTIPLFEYSFLMRLSSLPHLLHCFSLVTDRPRSRQLRTTGN